MLKRISTILFSLIVSAACIAATTTTPVKVAATAVAPPTATLSWIAPTQNVDGTAIAGTITYNVYQGGQGLTTLTNKVQSALTGLTATVTTGLTAGSTQCFAVTANVGGVESAQSLQACAAIPLPTPGSPSQITVVIH